MKKLISLVLALAMIMMVGAAFADDAAYSGTVSVSGLDNGDQVNFYQIIEWVGETADNSDVTGWKATSAFASILTKDVLTAMLVDTVDAEGNVTTPKTGITPELAGQLAALVNTNNIGSVNASPITATEGKASYTTNKPGTFMALVKPVKADTIYNPIFVSVTHEIKSKDQAASNYGEGSVVKKSTLKIEKTAANASDYNGDNAQTTAIGDIVNYTVKVTIPAYSDVYTNPHFVLKDTLTDLKLKQDTLTVSIDAANYTKAANDTGYTITFAPEYLLTLKTSTEVTVTYSAEVTTKALKAINEETNDVMIEYSHDPSNENDFDVKKDTTQHYTFTIDASGFGEYSSLTGKRTSEIIKTAVDANGKPIHETVNQTEIIDDPVTWKGALEGAKFGLWKNSECTGDAYLEATSDETGRMTFAGLDAGNYWLKEISAPDGFVTNTTIHPVVLTASVDTVSVTEYYDPADGKWYSEDGTGRKAATYETTILKNYTVTVDGATASSYTFTNASTSNSNEIQWTTLDPVELPCNLINTRGTELPSTGGIGTTIFYIVGGILLVGAAVILVARRKAQD